MYDQELLERNLHPEFKGELEKVAPIELVNASCGDELKIFLKTKNGVIIDGRFSGVGCAISQVSADVFIEAVKGKTVTEAKKIRDDFYEMILGAEASERVEKAKCLKCVSRMPARVKCAKLAWESLEKIA